MMKSLDSFIEIFSLLDKECLPRIISTSDEDYFFRIIVENVYRHGNTLLMLKKFFGNPNVLVLQIK